MWKSPSQILRPILNQKTKGKCYYCGTDTTGDNFTIEHIIPLCSGGTDEFENLMPCCKSCNSRKCGRDIEYFRFRIMMNKFKHETGIQFTPQQAEWLEQNDRGLNLDRHAFWFEENLPQ